MGATAVRFMDAIVDSIHHASHEIEDEDLLWYSKVELAEIEEENDFLVDNAPMLKKTPNADEKFCWRGLEEKAKRLPFIQTILELWNEQKEKGSLSTIDWEALRSTCEKESTEAREKAQKLADKDRMEALTACKEEQMEQ